MTKAIINLEASGYIRLENRDDLEKFFPQRQVGLVGNLTVRNEPKSYPCYVRENRSMSENKFQGSDVYQILDVLSVWVVEPEVETKGEAVANPSSVVELVKTGDSNLVPVTVTIKSVYDTSHTDDSPSDLVVGLVRGLHHFIGSGLLTSGTNSIVDTYDVSVEVTAVQVENDEERERHVGVPLPEWQGPKDDFAHFDKEEYEFVRGIVNAHLATAKGNGCEECNHTGMHGIDRVERHDGCSRFESDEEAQAFITRMVRGETHASDGRPGRVVVCAANKYGDVIVAGARHHDMVMNNIIRQLPDEATDPEGVQGFIDQFGVFMTREEAYEVAVKQGQRRYRCGNDEHKLWSENLY